MHENSLNQILQNLKLECNLVRGGGSEGGFCGGFFFFLWVFLIPNIFKAFEFDFCLCRIVDDEGEDFGPLLIDTGCVPDV